MPWNNCLFCFIITWHIFLSSHDSFSGIWQCAELNVSASIRKIWSSFGANRSLKWQTCLFRISLLQVWLTSEQGQRTQQKEYSLFDLTFWGTSLCYLCIIFLRQRARQALAFRYIWLPALHTTESCCRFHFMKSFHLTLMLLKNRRGMIWNLPSGQILAEKFAPSSAWNNSYLAF